MVLYIIIYIALFLYALFFNKNTFFLLVTLFLFSFLIGFRALSVGVDTMTYSMMYKSIGIGGYNGYPEWGFGFLCQFFYGLGFTFPLFQTCLCFFTLSFSYYVIYKKSPYPGFSVFCLYTMFFIFYTMNINRQIMASFILLLAYYFFLQNSRKGTILFLFLVVFACGFHSSAVLALSLFFIYKIPMNKALVFFLLIGSFVLGISITNDFLDPLIGGYDKYLNTTQGARTFDRTLLAVFLCSYWSLLFFFILFTSKRFFVESKYMKIYLFVTLINNVLIKQELGIRIMLLISIIQILIFPLYIQNTVLSKKIAMIFIMFLLSIFFFTFLLNNSSGVVPYKLNTI